MIYSSCYQQCENSKLLPFIDISSSSTHKIKNIKNIVIQKCKKNGILNLKPASLTISNTFPNVLICLVSLTVSQIGIFKKYQIRRSKYQVDTKFLETRSKPRKKMNYLQQEREHEKKEKLSNKKIVLDEGNTNINISDSTFNEISRKYIKQSSTLSIINTRSKLPISPPNFTSSSNSKKKSNSNMNNPGNGSTNDKNEVSEKIKTISISNIKRFRSINMESSYCTIEVNNIDTAGVILLCVVTGRILVVFGNISRKWSFPKGHRDTLKDASCAGNYNKLEEPNSTALRELKEETGIILSKSDLDTKNIVSSRNTDIYFFGYCDSRDIKYKSPEPLDKKEILIAKWMFMSELRNISSESKNSDLNFYCKLG